jgi:hypothetical protein
LSLWTPGGEHEVPRESQQTGRESTPAGPASSAGTGNPDLDDLTPEEQAEAQAMMAEMAEVQQRIADSPASDVLANHLMGFYELAAIHLSQQPPNFREAAVAIDALRLVTEGMTGRLGENEPTLHQALQQIQMAFVQLTDRANGGPELTDPNEPA